VRHATIDSELELGVPDPSLGRRLVAEFTGTAMLVAIVIGSGIAASRMSADTGLQLLENAAATGAGLIALILTFGHVSGARFNPLISAVAVLDGDLRPGHAGLEVLVQVAGGIVGAALANLMFDLGAVAWSTHDRVTSATFVAEVAATFGLLTVILGVVRSPRADAVAYAVGAYIAAAYWFTSSTSFANPAVTIARTVTDTFAGIAPASAPAFIGAQILGAGAAVLLDRYLYPRSLR